MHESLSLQSIDGPSFGTSSKQTVDWVVYRSIEKYWADSDEGVDFRWNTGFVYLCQDDEQP